MRLAPFSYEEPTDLRQAFQGLEKGVPFAGGQNLMPALRMRQLQVNSLISLEKIIGLKKEITYTASHIQLGALTTIRGLLDCHVLSSLSIQSARNDQENNTITRESNGKKTY